MRSALLRPGWRNPLSSMAAREKPPFEAVFCMPARPRASTRDPIAPNCKRRGDRRPVHSSAARARQRSNTLWRPTPTGLRAHT